MFQIRQLALTMIMLSVFSLVCMSQTRADLRRDFGEPKENIYSIKPGTLLKADFDDTGQASIIKFFLDDNNKFGGKNSEFIDRKTASEIVKKFTTGRDKGDFVRSITFSASCTTIENENYVNVRISYNLICSKEKSMIKSIDIHWKKRVGTDN